MKYPTSEPFFSASQLSPPKDTPNNAHHQCDVLWDWTVEGEKKRRLENGKNTPPPRKGRKKKTSNEWANFPKFHVAGCRRNVRSGGKLCAFKGGERYTHFHRLFMAVFQSNFGWKLLAQFLLYLLLLVHIFLSSSALLFWGFMLHLGEIEQVWL